MQETFEVYSKRTQSYKAVSCVVIFFFCFILMCIFFPQVISKAPQTLMVCLFLVGLSITIGSMFMGVSSMKAYKSDGQLILTNSSISINEIKFELADLSFIETTASQFKGLGTRGGFSDGSGNKIVVVTNDNVNIENKFVINSKIQKDNLTLILKSWKKQGFKIISNGIDLV